MKKTSKKEQDCFGFCWIFVVVCSVSGPFNPKFRSSFYAISIVAAILIMIPIGLAMFFWSLNPPASDVKKRKDQDSNFSLLKCQQEKSARTDLNRKIFCI